MKLHIIEIEADIRRCRAFVSKDNRSTDDAKFSYLLSRMNCARQSSLPSKIKHAQNEYQIKVEALTAELKQEVATRQVLLEAEVRTLEDQQISLLACTQKLTDVLYAPGEYNNEAATEVLGEGSIVSRESAVRLTQLDCECGKIVEDAVSKTERALSDMFARDEFSVEAGPMYVGAIVLNDSSHSHAHNFLQEASRVMNFSVAMALASISQKHGTAKQLKRGFDDSYSRRDREKVLAFTRVLETADRINDIEKQISSAALFRKVCFI